MKTQMRKVLLWLWPQIRAIYARCELQVDLLDQRILAGVARLRPEAAAAEMGTGTTISGAHAHGAYRGARVAGGHVLVMALLWAVTVQAAPSPDALNAVHNAFRGYANPFRMGEPLDPQGGGSQSGPAFRFDGSYNLLVNCITGCSSSSGFTDNSLFTVGSSTINPIGALYTTGTPSISSGNAGRLRMDSNSYLYVDCVTGCSASAGFADNSSFTAGTTAIGITGGWYSSSPTNCTSGDACAPQLTIDRKLFVQDFQGTSPWVVSANGGSFAVTQSGTWTVQPGNTANTTAWLVTGTGGTFPATQSGTWTVQQGGAPWSMVGTLTNNNAAPSSNNLGVLPCLVGSAPSPASGDLNTLSCDTSGNVRVVVPGSVAVTGTFWQTTQPVSCTAANCAENLAQVNGNTTSTSYGASGSGTQRTITASASPFLKTALSTTVTTVTSSAGYLDSVVCNNGNGTENSVTTYIQIFDTTGTVTLGSTTPTLSIPIPPSNPGGATALHMNIANGVKVAATTTATGSSAPTTAVDCNFGVM